MLPTSAPSLFGSLFDSRRKLAFVVEVMLLNPRMSEFPIQEPALLLGFGRHLSPQGVLHLRDFFCSDLFLARTLRWRKRIKLRVKVGEWLLAQR